MSKNENINLLYEKIILIKQFTLEAISIFAKHF
jgi:hypothetical protein